MNKKQWFLINFSLKRKIVKKSFVISNIVLLILIALVSNMDTIIRSFGGDFEEPYTIYYQDDLEENAFEVFNGNLTGGYLEVENDLTVINEAYELTDADANVVVVELSNDLEAVIASNDLIPNSVYSAITASLNSIKMQLMAIELDLTPEDMMNLQSGVPIERVVVNDEGASEIGSLIEEGLGIVIVMPLFFGLIMIVQMIGLEIFDEKSTKAMEVIMSNVDPETHLKSKIFAANIFSLVQFTLIFVYGLIGLGIRKLITNINIDTGGIVPFDISEYTGNVLPVIAIVIVLYLVTNVLYSMVMAILASTANEMDDYQKIISPIMILMVAGFYIAIFSPLIEGATFVKVAAYIPFFSLMIVPGLYAGGTIGFGSLLIILGVMVVFTYIIYRVGVPIYKQSVLDYSTDNVFKRLMSNIRRSRE